EGSGEFPPCAGLTSNALPEAQSAFSAESSQTGVSTRNAPIASKPKMQKEDDIPHWYALRTTYGREKKAYDYMTAKGITAFYPTTNVVKLIKGKRKVVTESLLPNIFFAYGTEEQLKSFVYDNVNLPFLRFYYRYIHVGRKIEKTPMVVPNYQMESLKIVCAAEVDDIIVSIREIPKFEKGQLVRITKGAFAGVIGTVARYKGQQRVAVIMNGLVTAVTAYIPTPYLDSIV
ncbi:MAG: UpxY family transcription antiterminator, partial [Streptococcus sp.]|nr:UpxY family transcription antiterminator [Streptococcus sp.]